MEKYKVIKKIGQGSFGTAMLCRAGTSGGAAGGGSAAAGRLVVVKQVDIRDMGETEKRAAMKEATILAHLDHPCIIRHIESFEDRDAGQLCIVTEYAERGDLAQRLAERRGAFMPEAVVLDWFAQLCLALHYLHKRKILHRDLKLQNVFVAGDNEMKLGDFGIARVLKHTMECARTVVGTPYYLSPEICQNLPYNAKSDVWSLGCILYELCALKHAFEAGSITALVRKILKGRTEPLPAVFSVDMCNLIDSMLQVKPTARPSVARVLQTPLLQPYVRAFMRRVAARGCDYFQRHSVEMPIVAPFPSAAAAAATPDPGAAARARASSDSDVVTNSHRSRDSARETRSARASPVPSSRHDPGSRGSDARILSRMSGANAGPPYAYVPAVPSVHARVSTPIRSAAPVGPGFESPAVARRLITPSSAPSLAVHDPRPPTAAVAVRPLIAQPERATAASPAPAPTTQRVIVSEPASGHEMIHAAMINPSDVQPSNRQLLSSKYVSPLRRLALARGALVEAVAALPTAEPAAASQPVSAPAPALNVATPRSSRISGADSSRCSDSKLEGPTPNVIPESGPTAAAAGPVPAYRDPNFRAPVVDSLELEASPAPARASPAPVYNDAEMQVCSRVGKSGVSRVLAAANVWNPRGTPAVGGLVAPGGDSRPDDGDSKLMELADSLLPHGLPLQDYRAATIRTLRGRTSKVSEEVVDAATLEEPAPPHVVGSFVKQKFLRNGVTWHAPYSTARDPPAYRVEALRIYLSDEIGEEMLLRVHAQATGNTDEMDVVARTRAALGSDRQMLVPLLFQLIRLEQLAFAN